MSPIHTTLRAVAAQDVRSSLKGALLALSLLAAGIACSSTSTPADTSTPVPADTPTPAPTPAPISPLRLGLLDLGAIDHIIHDNRSDGPTTRSVLLAIKHVNDAGGVLGAPVEARFSDTDDQISAVEHANRLIDEEGVHVFVGPFYSDDVIELSDAVAVPRQSLFVSPSAASIRIGSLEDDGFIFRTTMSNIAQAYALAELAEEEGYDNVAVIYLDNEWGLLIDQAFEDYFDGEVTSVPIEALKDSYREEILAANANEPDAAIFITRLVDLPTILDDIMEAGAFDGNYLLLAHYRTLSTLEANPELEGSKGVALYGRHVTEAEGHWEADYAAEYGDTPHSPFMREAYDAAVALMLAAEYAGSTDGAAIRDALPIIANPPGIRFPASSDGIEGALEAIRNGQDIDLDGEATSLDWDANGDITVGGVEIWQFKDGAIENIRHFDVDVSE